MGGSIITHFLGDNVLLFLAVFLPIFSFSLYKWINPNRKKYNLPRSPTRLPIIGNLHLIGNHPHRSFQALSQKYGDLMLFHLGSKLAVIVSSPEIAALILKTYDNDFATKCLSTMMKKLLINGRDVFCSPYGERWRNLRSICVLHLFNNQRVRSFSVVREEEVELMVQSIRRRCLSAVNLSEQFLLFTNNIICRVAFGKKLSEGEDLNQIIGLVKDINELVGTVYVGDFIPWLGWIDGLRGLNAKASKVAREFDCVIERIIHRHSSDCTNKKEGEAKALIQVLIELRRGEGNGDLTIDTDGIKGIILDMFAGGTDTPVVMLEWTMSELIRNPRVMKELQKEVRGSVIGNKHILIEDDLKDMNYLKAVIKESLRLHTPNSMLAPRECTKDMKLAGFDVPAHTLVMINVWSISRDPRYWENADEFCPERFLNSSTDFKGQHFHYIPFSSGRRNCPGIGFSIPIIEMVIANLVYHFDWALPLSDGGKVETLDMADDMGFVHSKKCPLIAEPSSGTHQDYM